MVRRTFSLALVALLAAATLPAQAQDVAALRAKVASAMSGAKSFVVTTTAASGFSVTVTFVAPDRYHSALVYSGSSRDVVLIGSTAYISADGGQSYRKTDAPTDVISAQAQLRDVPVDQVLPDRTVNGKTWGQFATSTAGPQKDQHLTCTFDKKTYRINDCSNEGLQLTFSRYDDPANAVTVPSNIATPVPLPNATSGAGH